MSRNERIREKYPFLYAYGDTHAFLAVEEAVNATTEARIRSIWPFIVKRVLAFAESLKPRERVNFDPEDVLSELWVALAEKDHKWTPERGKYITFAGTIIDREFCSIRDRSRTVESPRNSSCRMKAYAKEEEDGSITPRRLKTSNDIRRTGDNTSRIAHGDKLSSESGESEAMVLCGNTKEPLEIVAESEGVAISLDAVKRAIRLLPPFEALVMGRLSGLWGKPKQSTWEIAWHTGREESEVRRAKSRAILRIRRHLISISHPAAESA